jgi:alkylation response protein AidB-like acyl-CoA dehydrogenase
MDFNDSLEEAAFRSEVNSWLSRSARLRSPDDLSEGQDASDADMVAANKAWQALKFDAGYAGITWPTQYGGRNGTTIQQVIYRQEEKRYHARGELFGIGLNMCLPIVHGYGSVDHKVRYVRKALRGEEIWCQLFSEPSAGSDVAGIRTKAERDGDHWVITGQKIWTTGAQFADFGILLARTDPRQPKHKGLTMFILNMKAPGVIVRPVRQMSGLSEFNEVFFDGVRVPDSDRLGPAGDGWKVAINTLMFERLAVGDALDFVDYEEILRIARRTTLGGKTAVLDARVRERVADMYLTSRALRLLTFRAQTALSKGGTPGPEQSIAKAVAAMQGQQASYLAMDLMNESGMLTARELGEQWRIVESSWTWTAAMRIAGGTDEILRNIIAERVLGLPQDIRVDKDVPFQAGP